MRKAAALLWALWLTSLPQCSAEVKTKDSQRPHGKTDPFDHVLHRLGTFHPKNGRKLVDHLNDDDDSPLPSVRSWVVSCSTPPFLQCNQCFQDLKDEQAQVISAISEIYPTTRVLAQTQRIRNSIYVELPYDAEIPLTIPGILRVNPQQTYTLDVQDSAAEVGATLAQQYCVTGKQIKVGVIDTGIDYTHAAMGGRGTSQAFVDAYGTSASDSANRERGASFPTSTVVDGEDFLGEDSTEFAQDNDPIDANGHGTAVASAVLAVAPDVKLVAVKSCITAPEATCPDFALVLGIEYLLDPNRDGSLRGKADVINLSLGAAFNRPYHDEVALSLEVAAGFGVVCVTSIGNSYNRPYVAGAIGTTPNVISVGAVNHSTDSDSGIRYMEDYSSRGPGEFNLLKPDLSAPSNSLMALSASGSQYARRQGTSFSAPLVAGAAALLLEHCPSCDPLAIKCLLMNTADRDVRYSEEEDERMAPVSRMGSGTLRVDKALSATLWAYSLGEKQPSLTFGIVDAFHDIIYTKTILINAIDTRERTIRFSHEFRDSAKGDSGVVTITFNPPTIQMPASCSSPVAVSVSLYVHADLAPTNTMSTSGEQGFDPTWLDRHEFDGHIIISSDIDQDAVLPFHMIVRQAAAPKFTPGTVLPSTWGPLDQDFTIINEGEATAQIDSYELIYSDGDDPEANFGIEEITADIRTIGYRTVPVHEPGCEYLVEFSFQTWERSLHVTQLTLEAEIYLDGEDDASAILFIPAYPSYSLSYVLRNGTYYCTGLPSDHASNTANTIFRACSDDLLLTNHTKFTVRFRGFAFPTKISTTFESEFMSLSFPTPRLSAPSYDVRPGETLREFHVTGEIAPNSFGLQLVTNAFRDRERTGAATAATETLLLTKAGIVLESEKTPDDTIWPGLFNQTGPPCGWSLPQEAACSTTPEVTSVLTKSKTVGEPQTLREEEEGPESPVPGCPPIEVPRLEVPSISPSSRPSLGPTRNPASPIGTAPTTPPSDGSTPTDPTDDGSGSLSITLWSTPYLMALACGFLSSLFV